MNPVGESIVTAQGIWALLEANVKGERVKVKEFVFSEEETPLDPNITKLEGWLRKDISLYDIIDDHTVEFVCDVPPDEAARYTKTAGLYLEDGTLFMLAKPPFPFPPMLRQTFKIQLRYQNAQNLLDFSYLPFCETEQDLSILENSAALGWEILELSKDVGECAMAIADYYRYKNQSAARLSQLQEAAKAHDAAIEELRLSALQSSAAAGLEILRNAQEIGLIKTYLKL